MELSDRDNFQTNIFNVILNNLLNELLKICQSNQLLTANMDLKNLKDSYEIYEKSETLKNHIYRILSRFYAMNLFTFIHIVCIKTCKNNFFLNLLEFLCENYLSTVFLNIKISYRMFICTAIRNYSSKRYFFLFEKNQDIYTFHDVLISSKYLNFKKCRS